MYSLFLCCLCFLSLKLTCCISVFLYICAVYLQISVTINPNYFVKTVWTGLKKKHIIWCLKFLVGPFSAFKFYDETSFMIFNYSLNKNFCVSVTGFRLQIFVLFVQIRILLFTVTVTGIYRQQWKGPVLDPNPAWVKDPDQEHNILTYHNWKANFQHTQKLRFFISVRCYLCR